MRLSASFLVVMLGEEIGIFKLLAIVDMRRIAAVCHQIWLSMMSILGLTSVRLGFYAVFQSILLKRLDIVISL